MSMPIQRQSEQFSVFDTGTRWERDRPQHELPRGLAGLVNSMGPRITGGMLNTRQGAITDPDPSEQEGVGDMNWGGWMRRNLDENGEVIGNPHSRKERERRRDEAFQQWIDSGAPHHGARTAADSRWVDSKDGSGRKKCKNCGGVGYGSCVCKDCDKCGSSYYGSCDCGGSKREAGWNYPEFDRTDMDDYDHDLDRPSAADFAEEDFERERKRNYPRGQGPAWNYDEDGDPDPYLEHLEETSDPERFISGSRRRLAVEEDYSGGDEDDPDWIRDNSPRQQEHNRKRGEEISRSKEMFGSRRPFDRAAARRLTAFADWKNHYDGDDWMGGHLTFHKAHLENGHELHAWRFENPEAGRGWNWGIVDPEHRPEREYSLPDEFKYLAKAGDDAGLDHGGQGNDSLIHGNQIDSFEEAKNEAQTHYEKMFPLGTNTGNHDSGVDYSDLNKFLRESARLAACQECGEEIYPDEGWHHINGYPDEYDHEANPESVDFDGDEYGMHKDPAEAYDKLKYRQLQDEYRQGSRTAKDSKCTCWEGYERVPGTEPCSEDSCRKESMRLAGAGIDDRDVRPGPLVDVPLYEQDPDDYFGSRPYKGAHCPDCGKPMPWVSGPTCRHGNLLVDAGFLNGRPDHTDVSWQETADGWEHPVTGCRVQASEKFPGEWEMVAPTSSKRRPYSIIDHHTDPHAMMARHDRTTGYAPRTARTADVMQQDPALQAPLLAGGYQLGHRIGLQWRDQVIPGTVIGLDGPNVGIRWDDGQYSTEEPHNIRLL